MENKKKMKKMLFITPRNPFSGRFSGDVIRARKFIGYLKYKYSVTLLSTDRIKSKKSVSKLKSVIYKDESIFFKLLHILKNVLNLKPMQLGYFYSKKVENYIKNNHSKFDIIFCQSVRVAQYVNNFSFTKNILDMGDLYSSNYLQTFKSKSFLNPLKYIYFIESLLIKKYEFECLEHFDKIFLFSKKEIKILKKYKKKIDQINFGIDSINKIFKFKKKNNKIIFIGNIHYLPNRDACKYFAKNILPIILKIDPSITFHIIGDISKIDKFLLEKNKSITVHGKVKKLDNIISNSICGLANLKVSSGIQTKILTYMSYGLPCISSKNVIENFDSIPRGFIPFYKNDKELIELIFKLKNDRTYSEKISKNSFRLIVKFKWSNVLKKLKLN